MMKRKGLGKGLGMGYKNIVPRDPFIHGLSAKGVRTFEPIVTIPIMGLPKKQLIDRIALKYGYKSDLTKKEIDYVFKKNNIKGIESRFIEVMHKRPINAKGNSRCQLCGNYPIVRDNFCAQCMKKQRDWEKEQSEIHLKVDAKGKSLYAKMSATELEKNLSMFIGTEQYHKLSFMPLLATDGVAYLMKEAESYWLFDAIASYQPKLKKEPFQVWILEKDKTGSGAVLKGYRDYSEKKPKKYKPLVTQKIPYTDFPLKKVKIWVENGVALLPSEH